MEIASLLETAPALSSSDTHLVMMDRYNDLYGLSTPEMDNHPLGLILMREQEDVTGNSLLMERVKTFMGEQITKHTGLSLAEFLSLPRDIVLTILDEAAEANKRENNEQQTLLNNLPKLPTGR